MKRQIQPHRNVIECLAIFQGEKEQTRYLLVNWSSVFGTVHKHHLEPFRPTFDDVHEQIEGRGSRLCGVHNMRLTNVHRQRGRDVVISKYEFSLENRGKTLLHTAQCDLQDHRFSLVIFVH